MMHNILSEGNRRQDKKLMGMINNYMNYMETVLTRVYEVINKV
jgi:hypothetical protein